MMDGDNEYRCNYRPFLNAMEQRGMLVWRTPSPPNFSDRADLARRQFGPALVGLSVRSGGRPEPARLKPKTPEPQRIRDHRDRR